MKYAEIQIEGVIFFLASCCNGERNDALAVKQKVKEGHGKLS